MTRWCRDCGDQHECTAEEVADTGRTQIRLAEIGAERDVEIARLQASTVAEVVDSAAVVDAAAAEGRADGMETALEDLSGGAAAAEAEPDGQAEIVEFPAEPVDQAEVVPDMPEQVSVTVPSEPKRAGYWDNYA